MHKINELFRGLADKMPFAKDWFAKSTSIGSLEINNFFFVLAIIAIVLLIVIVAIIISACVKHGKKSGKKDKSNNKAQAVAPAQPEQNKADDELIIVESKHEELKVESNAASDVAEPQKEEPQEEEAPVQEAHEQPVVLAEPVEERQAPQEDAVIEDVPVVEEVAVAEEPKEEPVKEEPVKEKPKAEDPKPQPVKKPVPAVKNTSDKERTMEKKVFGSFEISLCIDGYRFRLYANNKQLLFESTGFTSVDGALKGIDTFRKTVAESSCFVTKDKFGRFRYIFNKRYQGENYTTAKSAASAAESVKRFAPDAKLNVIDPTKEELAAFTDRKNNQRTKADVDWDKIAKDEAAAKPMGKFTVDEERADEETLIGYRYFLIANNGQILYTSAIYASAKSARDGIDAFKRAVYIDNFYIDEDKFGHFRYILRGEGNSTYVGESYTSKASAENAKKSVEKFVVCAPIVNA